MASLAEPLLAALEVEARDRLLARGDLEAELGRALARAHRAWPDVRVPDPILVHFIAERLGARELTELPMEDLYIACACACGTPRAIEFFERAYIAPLTGVLERAVRNADIAAEALQRLRVQLLTGADGKPPQIATYRGSGPLRSWLRVVATREAIRLACDRDPHLAEDEQLASHVAAVPSIELEYFRRVYSREVLAALRTALATLEARQQNVLRHHYLDRLGIDNIARLHHVHRATAARWLESARGELVRSAQRALKQQLGLPAEDMASLVRLMQSRLDVSLRRVFSR